VLTTTVLSTIVRNMNDISRPVVIKQHVTGIIDHVRSLHVNHKHRLKRFAPLTIIKPLRSVMYDCSKFFSLGFYRINKFFNPFYCREVCLNDIYAFKRIFRPLFAKISACDRNVVAVLNKPLSAVKSNALPAPRDKYRWFILHGFLLTISNINSTLDRKSAV